MNFETAKKRQYKNGSVRYYIIIKSHQYHHLTIIGILCRFQTIISNLFWKIWKIIKDLILWKWMYTFTTRMGVSQGCLSPLALFLVTLSGLTPFPYYQLNMLSATWEQFQTSEFHLLKLCCFLLWFSFFGRELVLVGARNRRSMSLFHTLLQSSGISFDPIHRHLFWFDKLPRGVIPHAIFIDWIDLLHSEIVAATGFEVDCQALYSVVIQIGVLQLLVRWWKVPRITAGEHEENFETVWFVISWMTSASIVPG